MRLDDHGNDDSMTVLEELEQIDDDCDKHGIQFVKIDDARTADEFGIDSVGHPIPHHHHHIQSNECC